MTYRQAFGKFFLDSKDMTMIYVVCKGHRTPKLAYHAQIINLSKATMTEVRATFDIPTSWTQVDVKMVPKDGE